MSKYKLKNILNSKDQHDLGSLVANTKRLAKLTENLSFTLPESDRHAIVAANIKNDGELIVICASSAWASRLRYKTKALISAANQTGLKANSCKIRVSEG